MAKYLIIVLTLCFSGISYAQDWQQVRGLVQDIAINDKGDVYAAAMDGVVWRWRNEQARWSKISGELKRIAIGPNGRIWGVGLNNQIYRRNGLWWDELKETALDISVAYDGTIIRADINDQISVRDKFSNRWKQIFGREAVRVAVIDKNNFWIVQRDGALARYDGKFWHDIEGIALDISADRSGNIYIASYDGTVQKFTDKGWRVVPETQNAASLAIGPEENIWYAAYDGQTFAMSLFQPESDQQVAEAEANPSSKLPNEITDTSPIVFTQVRGLSQQLSIGADGSIYSINAEGRIERWSNSQRQFRDFPGSLARLAVDPSGNLWGVNSRREIFRHTGNDWKNVRGTAADISISQNGDVFISDPSERLYRLNENQTRFERIQGRGNFIAAHPNGEIWTIRRDGKIFRCNDDKCTRLKRTGEVIAIGPDGSVFMADPNRRLFLFDESNNDWKRVETSRSVRALGVGPKGRPWIADTNGSVYSSAFFERDESNDQRVASTTNRPTVVTASIFTSPTASSVFKFKKNIKWEEFDAAAFGADELKIGIDGSVWLSGCTGLNLKLFNEKNETFEVVDFTIPGSGVPRVVSSDADGRVWMVDNAGDVFRQKKSGSNSFDEYPIDTTNSAFSHLAIGGDGSVFVVDSDNELNKLNETKDKFEKFDNATNFSEVAVMPDGTPWVITTSNELKAWDGSKFDDPGKSTMTNVSDIAIGAGGTVFITEGNISKIMKWNATNKDFDETTTSATNSTHVAVDPDGRPWYSPGTCNSIAFRAK